MKQHLRLFSLLFIWVTFSFNVSGQSSQMHTTPANNWQNESIEQDSVYGTGSDRALNFLKGRKSTTVIVAVIDGGVYINHPALKANIWVNPKEIPGNRIDDEHNGYVDDVHGWDFIGGKDSDVRQDNLELTRLYRDLGKKYANTTADKVSKDDKAEYNKYLAVKKEYESKKNATEQQYDNLKGFIDTIGMIKVALGKNDFTKEDLESYSPSDSAMVKAKRRVMRNFNRFRFFMKGATADSIIRLLQPGSDHLNVALKYQYNVDFDPRFIVGDNYADATERYYGNNDVIGPTDAHGTHVSGIIAAVRTGKPGAQEGIADNVKILVVRAVPDGDERDKDVANAIRYAVDNGAKVINMSFGKGYSYNKKAVDAAVKYAEAHDVLLVHASGNDHNDNDSVTDYPNPRYEGTHKHAKNWIEVGASDSKGYPGSFSNYGKKTVDLFAPGVRIYSTIPDSSYAHYNGTSMAAPCVAGVAAIIREYFPNLSAKQVKKILMKSVTKIDFKVPLPGNNDKMVSYTDLCASGGIINAAKAVRLAMKISGK
ncbi:MAG: S8 family peptidase [Bacteroidia bacterium]